ncbi:MAG TPA: hypothetical protein DER01_02730 [Phycisphaerales bacterium]|nr:hypothetical protein [Phycisphaerales bacterium]|tara:strand:+ start:7863 stop:9056 length:1194 start_codon:yes stop_codon:yes gene_type:complete
MASLKKRGNRYQIQYYVGKQQRRISLGDIPYQVAKEKLRQFESAQFRGDDIVTVTQTPIAEVVGAYVDHIRAHKTAKSAQTDVYYLRDAFGPICDQLKRNPRTPSSGSRKKPVIIPVDKRKRRVVIEANTFEQITTADVAMFIATQVQQRGLAPKTANRYREILCRLFNWAMTQKGINMPGDKNPVAKVERYRERPGAIRYLTLPQVEEQLHSLRFKPQLQTMVAMLIYAGLRRAELLWLTTDDVDLRAGRFGIIRIRAKAYQGETWHGKTRGSVRAIPISSQLRQYLDRYTPRPADGPDDSDACWYFPSPQGTRWDEDNFSADLRAANRDAGLSWSSLDFRHTFGSQLAQNGVSLYKISQLMGNSPEICRRHYAALVPEAMADEVEFEKINISQSM